MKKYLIVYAHAGGAVPATWGIFTGMNSKDATRQASILDTADPNWFRTSVYLVAEVEEILQAAVKP